jgi:hypothetical protein
MSKKNSYESAGWGLGWAAFGRFPGCGMEPATTGLNWDFNGLISNFVGSSYMRLDPG